MDERVSGVVLGVLVDDLHISTSNIGVIKHVSKKMMSEYRFDRNKRKARKQLYRLCLERHQKNVELYDYVMGPRPSIYRD